MSAVDPQPPVGIIETCTHCGRRVIDASTDFGGGLSMRPVPTGIQVEVDGRVLPVTISSTDLRVFLNQAYGSCG